jgi:hypothetical protein
MPMILKLSFYFIEGLNDYCQGKTDFKERRRCHDPVERTSKFLNEILIKYDLH